MGEPSHWTYEPFAASDDLRQGDIIRRTAALLQVLSKALFRRPLLWDDEIPCSTGIGSGIYDCREWHDAMRDLRRSLDELSAVWMEIRKMVDERAGKMSAVTEG